MKKRIRQIITVILVILVLTSCTSTKTRKKVINQLTKHEVISKKWELVAETSTVIDGLFPDTESYDYIYKTKDDTYNVIRIFDDKKEYHLNPK